MSPTIRQEWSFTGSLCETRVVSGLWCNALSFLSDDGGRRNASDLIRTRSIRGTEEGDQPNIGEGREGGYAYLRSNKITTMVVVVVVVEEKNEGWRKRSR